MGAVDSIKQPEYTGENRCTPCTVVNVGIGAAVAVGVGALTRPAVGGFVFLCSIAVIYLRGYLVPGTPRLTKRYLPPSVLRLFGKEPVVDRRRTVDADVDGSPREWLVAAGALTDGEDPKLEDAFATRWETAIEATKDTAVDEEAIETLLGTDDVSMHSETAGVVGGNRSVRWLSEAALAADVAAGEVFAERVAGWESLSPGDRIELLRGLRLFVRSCPDCGGVTEFAEETVDPCCDRPHTLLSVTCTECETVVGEDVVVGTNETVPAKYRAITGE
ncbi:MAG: hypothetical protein PPP58_09940 [Natronomonas sp.]